MLEVGCGRGIALAPIVRQRAPERLVGLDVDQGLLEEAAGTLAGLPVELVCGDVRALPFADASFDTVIDTSGAQEGGDGQIKVSGPHDLG